MSENPAKPGTVKALVATGLIMGGPAAGCTLGMGLGYLIEGDGASNVHQGFVVVMGLAFAGAIVGLIAGLAGTFRWLRKQ